MKPEDYEELSSVYPEDPDGFNEWRNNWVPLIDGGFLSGPSHSTPGIKVSSWIVDSSFHPGRIQPRFVELNYNCVGNGFGSRYKATCHGTNLYIGYCISEISQPSPVEGKGKAQEHEYYRQDFTNYQYFPLLRKHCNTLNEEAMHLSERMDYQMLNFLNSKEDREDCQGNFFISPT